MPRRGKQRLRFKADENLIGGKITDPQDAAAIDWGFDLIKKKKKYKRLAIKNSIVLLNCTQRLNRNSYRANKSTQTFKTEYMPPKS